MIDEKRAGYFSTNELVENPHRKSIEVWRIKKEKKKKKE
jgi:hypothetical protein